MRSAIQNQIFDHIFLTDCAETANLVSIEKNEPCASCFRVHPKLNCLGQYYQRYQYIRLYVEHIQTIREYFQPNKKARALERRCIVAKKGAICPIFEGNMPLKKDPLFMPHICGISWRPVKEPIRFPLSLNRIPVIRYFTRYAIYFY
jgi:hypothetical protein